MTCSDRKRESKACSLHESFLQFVWWIDVFTALSVIKMPCTDGAFNIDTEEGIGIFRIFSQLPLAVM